MSRALVLIAAMGLTFAAMRAYLHISPNTDLNVAGYDIHHLFTGLILLTLGADSGGSAAAHPSLERPGGSGVRRGARAGP